ncbi:sugar transporter SWEET1 isoform X1 [Lingula anatina]|uniref:Sugar transporter SWEET1 n=1 Tax=Lingula anatina TaxID=7574 RepID=A0A1S3KDY1_LINAN|nr:sugar transporter SWEET1 isoform X1 [Lingula anatina]|eukprot:XP_013420835.1 sugar transporter SWEET1 isoform X1 [Lingula anatina]
MGAMLYFETLTLKVVVQWTATLFTFVAFLAGIHSAHKIVKQGNTHEVSLVPYLSFFVGAVVWLKYGTLIHDPTIILVNIVGLCFQTVYIFIYYIYSLQKHFIYKQFAFAAAVVVPTLVYAKYLASSLAKATQVVGLVGCMLSLCSYCSPLATLSTVYMQFAAALAIILPMLAYCHYVAPTTAVAANVVGLIGSGLSIATFASPLATLVSLCALCLKTFSYVLVCLYRHARGERERVVLCWDVSSCTDYFILSYTARCDPFSLLTLVHWERAVLYLFVFQYEMAFTFWVCSCRVEYEGAAVDTFERRESEREVLYVCFCLYMWKSSSVSLVDVLLYWCGCLDGGVHVKEYINNVCDLLCA